MSLRHVCGVLNEDQHYDDYAIISFYTVKDLYSGAPDEVYVECGAKTYTIPLCSNDYSSCLESTKDAVTTYLNNHSRFFVFNHNTHNEYDDSSPLEDFIKRSLEQEGYTHNFMEKKDVSDVVKRFFAEIKPTSPSDLGMWRCVMF